MLITILHSCGSLSSCSLKDTPVCIFSLRPSDETHQTVTADGTVDDLAQAVDVILSHRQ